MKKNAGAIVEGHIHVNKVSTFSIFLILSKKDITNHDLWDKVKFVKGFALQRPLCSPLLCLKKLQI